MSSQSRWIRVTRCENIPLREGRAVQVDGKELAVFNLGDRFLAVENRCPHRGGPLSDGIVSGRQVVCPLHAWRVCLEDGSVVKPAEEKACVTSYRTKVEDGVVCVELAAQAGVPSAPAVGVLGKKQHGLEDGAEPEMAMPLVRTSACVPKSAPGQDLELERATG